LSAPDEAGLISDSLFGSFFHAMICRCRKAAPATPPPKGTS
jgi:hypothetical protein